MTTQSEEKPITGEIVATPDNKPAPVKPTKKQRQAEIKKRKFIKRYLDCGNAVTAYMEVYNVKKETAEGNASNLLASIDFGLLLEQSGITDKALITALQQGLAADKPFGKNAKIHPDYATRHQYLTTAMKIKKRIDLNEQKAPPAVMQGLQIIIKK